MNAGKSIKVALAKRSMNQKQLAQKMGVSTAYICRLAAQEHIGMGTVVTLASQFGMKVSDFLALGEDE